MKKSKLILGLVALSMSLSSILSFAASVSAGVPQMINYQGVLTDASGCPKDGNFAMAFSIYNDSGAVVPLWDESYPNESNDSVKVTQGNFNVLLGSTDPIPESLFVTYDSLWLEVEVNGEVLHPKQRIASVGYAFHSQFADTADHCWTVSDSDWVIQDTNIYRIEGNVGIGTMNPAAKLNVRIHDGMAVYAISDSGSGAYGGAFYGLRGGEDNIGVTAFGGCDVMGYPPGSHSNIGIWAITSRGGVPYPPSGDWAGYFNGDVRVVGNLDVPNNATIGEDLSVGGNTTVEDTLTVNRAVLVDGNVGIGTISPAQELDVVGTAQMTGFIMPTGAQNDYVLTSDASGEGTWQPLPGWIGGSGTTDYIAKFTGTTTIGNSVIYETGGNVGIGTNDPDYTLHVNGTAGLRDENGQGGLRVWPPGGDVVIGTTDNHLVGYVLDVAGDAVVRGDLRVMDSLQVDESLRVLGSIRFEFDYDTTFSINTDQTKTVTHNLGGDASKYIVFMDGISSNGGIHQSDFGTACYGVIEKCVGCEWFGLTSSQIKVYRATDDDDMSPSKDWDSCRIRILKNQ